MDAVPVETGFNADVEAFLRNIFGDDLKHAWVTGFAHDPAASSPDGKVEAIAWRGGEWATFRRHITPDANNFLCISTFLAGEDGRIRRRSALHHRTYALMIDDVGTRVTLDSIKLAPTFKVRTSPGSMQYWYVLREPETDGRRVKAVIDNLIAAGLCADNKDPGMRGVNRYGRLPFGRNTKAKYRTADGQFPTVELAEPECWDNRPSLDEFAAAFHVSCAAPAVTEASRPPLPAEADAFNAALLAALQAEGFYKEDRGGGKHEVTCPWVHEHTGAADNGTAIFEAGYVDAATGEVYQLGGFKCHHGHGEDVGLRHVVGILRGKGYDLAMLTPARADPVEEFADEVVLDDELLDLPEAGAVTAPGSVVVARYECTDTANEFRFIGLAAGRVRYLFEEKTWLFFDGTRWARDRSRAHVMEIAQAVCPLIMRLASEAVAGGRDDVAKKLTLWAIASRQKQKLEAMLGLLASAHALVVYATDLDTDPYLLGVPNGVVDLRTGAILPPDPVRLVTLSTGVAYDPAARAPRWERFLTEILSHRHGEPDHLLLDYFRLFLGYCVTGSRVHELFTIMHGAGTNGKSTLEEILQHVFGEYAKRVLPVVFEQTRNAPNASTASPELAKLAGARLVLTSETQERTRLDMALVKQATGDRITARGLYQSSFTYTPQFKVLMATNHLPVITETSHAAWRRLHPVPFDCRWRRPTDPCTEDNAVLPYADGELSGRLKAEATGILTWLVRAAGDWIKAAKQKGDKEGLGQPPARVAAAQVRYRANSDVIGHWIEERCEMDPLFEGTGLYTSYKGWCDSGNLRPISALAWSRDMEARGFGSRETHGVTRHVGIKLKEFK